MGVAVFWMQIELNNINNNDLVILVIHSITTMKLRSITSHISDWPITDHHMWKKTFRNRTRSICDSWFSQAKTGASVYATWESFLSKLVFESDFWKKTLWCHSVIGFTILGAELKTSHMRQHNRDDTWVQGWRWQNGPWRNSCGTPLSVSIHCDKRPLITTQMCNGSKQTVLGMDWGDRNKTDHFKCWTVIAALNKYM